MLHKIGNKIVKAGRSQINDIQTAYMLMFQICFSVPNSPWDGPKHVALLI